MSRVDLNYILRLARMNGYVTEGTLAFWTGRLGQSVYYMYRQLRQMCEDGLLDDDMTECVVNDNGKMLVFRPKESEGKLGGRGQ